MDIQQTANKLGALKIKAPTELEPGDKEIDVEIHKLSLALGYINQLATDCGEEASSAKFEWYKEQADLAESITDKDLEKLGIVKSNKFDLIKRRTAAHMKAYDHWANRERHWRGLFEVYAERIQVYKKTRMAPE